MSFMPLSLSEDGKSLWHITLDVTYEGLVNESIQDRIARVRKNFTPFIENGSGVKRIIIMKLPENE
jgi:hypothetical protein